MKSQLTAFFIVLALAFSGATASQPLAPDVLVKSVTLEVIDLIGKDKEIKGDRAKLVQMIDAKVLPHFNFAAMTALAVGPAWKKATPEQQKRLTDEFKTLLVRTYASALAAYSDQKFEFRALRAKPADTDVTVNVRVLQSGAQPVTIDYAMEKTPVGWKVYDMVVGGVSLVANYRTEFNNKINSGGIDGLIADLRLKNKNLEVANAPK
jgi:phospholipid transport system substrate-binding protein